MVTDKRHNLHIYSELYERDEMTPSTAKKLAQLLDWIVDVSLLEVVDGRLGSM